MNLSKLFELQRQLDEQQEIWKDIPGFDGKYQVSNLGRVRSLKYKNTNQTVVMKKRLTKSGYEYVGLRDGRRQKKYLVHRLVAICFVENPHNKEQVNHINGIKNDNRAENLEWVTRSENMIHADKNGLRNQKGERHSFAKLTAQDVRNIRNWRETNPKFFTTTKLAKLYGVKHYHITRICEFKVWKTVI